MQKCNLCQVRILVKRVYTDLQVYAEIHFLNMQRALREILIHTNFYQLGGKTWTISRF